MKWWQWQHILMFNNIFRSYLEGEDTLEKIITATLSENMGGFGNGDEYHHYLGKIDKELSN